MRFRYVPYILIVPAFLASTANTQDDSLKQMKERLKRDVTALAGNNMAGRGNGQPGLDKAIEYVVNNYKKMGLEPEIQRFPYRLTASKNEGPDGYFSNLIVTINGTDTELSSQHIVIGAHLDHLGTRPNFEGARIIYYGADDNASGTAAVMELVRFYQKSPPPRSLIFIHFSGEEWGMVGSKYWVSHPTVDINSVGFMVNLDMIGRLDAKKGKLTLTTMEMGENALLRVKEMAPTGINAEIDRGTSIFANASDHAPFAAKNIPTCFFFTGIHTDYHRTTDTIEKINWNGLATITQYAQTVISEYASSAELDLKK